MEHRLDSTAPSTQWDRDSTAWNTGSDSTAWNAGCLLYDVYWADCDCASRDTLRPHHALMMACGTHGRIIKTSDCEDFPSLACFCTVEWARCCATFIGQTVIVPLVIH